MLNPKIKIPDLITTSYGMQGYIASDIYKYVKATGQIEAFKNFIKEVKSRVVIYNNRVLFYKDDVHKFLLRT